jgi:hypothetical protein
MPFMKLLISKKAIKCTSQKNNVFGFGKDHYKKKAAL